MNSNLQIILQINPSQKNRNTVENVSFIFCFWANIHNFMSIQCLANLLRPMNGMSSELIKWKYKIVETLKEYTPCICNKPWFSQLSWYLVLGIEGKKIIWYLLKAGFDHSQLIKIICYKKSKILKINFVIIWFGLVFDKTYNTAMNEGSCCF